MLAQSQAVATLLAGMFVANLYCLLALLELVTMPQSFWVFALNTSLLMVATQGSLFTAAALLRRRRIRQ